MLENLEIVNGKLSPKFDPYNDTYSVFITEDVDSLVLNYTITDGCEINIINNSNLDEKENLVYLEIITEKEKNVYTLIVNKEKSTVASTFDEGLIALETSKEPEVLPDYVAPLIAIFCFLIILFAFVILFRKKKNK